LHHTALAEAIVKKIPVVALANVDANPDKIDYVVPGNDKAKKSIEWFLKNIERAIESGVAARVVAPKPEEAKAAEPKAEVAAA
jgi:small subunit ribosomal protein S2